MNKKVTPSINQLSYGMTPEELISEGHVDIDYFDGTDLEEIKKDVKEMERIARESEKSNHKRIIF